MNSKKGEGVKMSKSELIELINVLKMYEFNLENL